MPPRKIKVDEPIIEEPELVEEEPIKKIKKVRVVKPKPVETEIVFVEEPVKKVRVKKEKIERPATPTAKPKRQSKWINALKEYNKDRGSYLIPKKGTEEYDSVRKMMESMSV